MRLPACEFEDLDGNVEQPARARVIVTTARYQELR